MRPTFAGFETAKSAINYNQRGLDVTLNNITNAVTPGYTRQRLEGYAVNMNYSNTTIAPPNGVRVGYGVGMKGVSQIRDPFLDSRYRAGNSEYSQYNTTLSGLKELENFFDESSMEGITDAVDTIVKNLQALTRDPDKAELAKIVMTSTKDIAQILRTFDKKLNVMVEQQLSQAKYLTNERFNAITETIGKLNKQIKDEYMHKESTAGNTGSGDINEMYGPNELLDDRNNLIDELSSYADIKITTNSDGTVDISLNNTDDGSGQQISLVKGEKTSKINFEFDAVTNTASVTYEKGNGTPKIDITDSISKSEIHGSIGAFVNLINGKGAYANTVQGENNSVGIAYFKETINTFAETFVTQLNTVNNPLNDPTLNLFDPAGITAGNISLSADFLNDPLRVISNTVTPGDGSAQNTGIQRLIGLFDSRTVPFGTLPGGGPEYTGNFKGYLNFYSNELSTKTAFYQGRHDSSQLAMDTISTSRENVSAVSPDEEAVNMMTYQKAFNAASRFMTVLDEALGTIISSMGVVGR
ncbi:MAG: flagellar hook-associated protein FlgK [Oscillospiraceae bacterium]